MSVRKCGMCGDYFEIPKGKDDPPTIVYHDGVACRESWPVPKRIQAEVSHNLNCPMRPGGSKFSVWLAWQVRQWFGLTIVHTAKDHP